MNGPLALTGVIGGNLDIIGAFVIGLSFGLVIEQAGFSSARRVAAFFYGRNMAVPRVMFTAIVTAAAGLLLASAFGLVDASLLTVNTTYILPHLLGGLLVGVGMATTGFCPGTALTSVSIGRLDAMAALAGIFVGVASFGFAMPVVEKVYYATRVGNVTLMQTLGVSAGYLTAALAVAAVVMFALLGWVERRFGEYRDGEEPVLVKQFAGAGRWLAAATVVVGLMAGLAGFSYLPGDRSESEFVGKDFQSYFAFMPEGGYAVEPGQLEEMINGGLRPHYLVDVRSRAELKTGALPGAVHIDARQLRTAEQIAELKRIKRPIVLYDQNGSKAFQLLPLLRANEIEAYALAGGLDAYALHQSGGASPTLQPGKAAPPPPPSPTPSAPAGNKKGAAFEDSGC
ncbi:MAG: rhodanese-like domain-containing protein [Candidatus Lernaella stagnicola]|nr:rhodanese-like domain-containing protein [Candidatus Lernaella stagnicola]